MSGGAPAADDLREDDELVDDDEEDERRHGKSKVGTIGGNASEDAGGRSGRSNRPRNGSQSDGRSSHSRSPMQRHAESRRVPYFRYFGPTAIVPGFKQMVVAVRDRRRSTGGGSFSAASPCAGLAGHVGFLGKTTQSDSEVAAVEDLPIYDPNDAGPVPPLILGLVKTFFHHLGCNYPFLKEEKFYQLVKEKRVEPILVDAVCSLAARFSDATIFTSGSEGRIAKSDFGQFYAQRAKAATVDTFPCPTVGAVQACLLMAYEGFGANQDSALWMYLGLAIRMAVDLGLQKMVGVRYQGEKDPWYTRHWSGGGGPDAEEEKPSEDSLSLGEQREVEQERIDTFWAVFTLDRVISSGTGRPVTFRDDDFELALPEPFVDPPSGCPDPYPHFVRIIHLYGRVSDVLNNIRNAKDLTTEKWNKLSKMESELTQQHQALGRQLEFNANNFGKYVNAGKGTTFILLHFWFHALIIVLHQPTLLAPFGGLSHTHKLLPNSRELSMSSAKTIADILAFAELIDPKSFIGNPFTSQPMYIAACAFLMESAANASEPPSPREDMTNPIKHEDGIPRPPIRHAHTNSRSSTKHSILASAASQNYQRCYNSLAQLHTYWGGVKYILTALDQKSEGIQDVETYTHEEYESTKLPRRGSMSRFPHFENPSSPIAFSLTGTTNSPNSNLTLMYQNMGGSGGPTSCMPLPSALSIQQQLSAAQPSTAHTPPGNMIYDPIRQSLPETPASMFPPAYPQPTTSAIRHSPLPPSKGHRLSTSSISSIHTQGKPVRKFDGLPPDEVTTPPSSVDLGRQTPKMHMLVPQTFTPSSQHSSGYESSLMPSASPASTLADTHHAGNGNQGPASSGAYGTNDGMGSNIHGMPLSYGGGSMGAGQITEDITFDSQEIDIGVLGLQNEMMPWGLEYIHVMGIFDNASMHAGA
jgi:hypothetical protein